MSSSSMNTLKMKLMFIQLWSTLILLLKNFVIFRVCSGGELFERIIEKEFFSEHYAAKVFKQILEAINYCHNNGVCHRDLKPENFLYETKDDNSDLKVIDFGLSKILDGGCKNNYPILIKLQLKLRYKE